MCKLKLHDFQKEIVKSNDRNIICNWSKGLGKTYTLACKILDNKPSKVLWVGDFSIIGNKINEALKFNEFTNEIKEISTQKNRIIIKFNNNPTIIDIKNYNDIKNNDLLEWTDLVVFNDMLPYDIKNVANPRQTISMITVNNYDKKLQKLFPNLKISEYGEETLLKYQMASERFLLKMKRNNSSRYYNEIDILSIPENIIIKTPRNNRLEELMQSYQIELNNKFIIQTLARLQTEYDEINPSKDNVLTRQNLLKMIAELYDLIEKVK